MTFEPVTSDIMVSKKLSRVAVRPSIGIINKHISDLVTQMQWSRLSVIYSQNAIHEQVSCIDKTTVFCNNLYTPVL